MGWSLNVMVGWITNYVSLRPNPGGYPSWWTSLPCSQSFLQQLNPSTTKGRASATRHFWPPPLQICTSPSAGLRSFKNDQLIFSINGLFLTAMNGAQKSAPYKAILLKMPKIESSHYKVILPRDATFENATGVWSGCGLAFGMVWQSAPPCHG